MEESVSQYAYAAFISYSSADQQWVRRLVDRLRAEGIPIYLDEDDLGWGQGIRPALTQAIESSRHLVLVMSPDSVGSVGMEGSAWVELERLVAAWNDPSNRGRHVLPLMYRPCPVPVDLRPFRFLDVTTEEKLEAAWPMIARTLGKWRD